MRKTAPALLSLRVIALPCLLLNFPPETEIWPLPKIPLRPSPLTPAPFRIKQGDAHLLEVPSDILLSLSLAFPHLDCRPVGDCGRLFGGPCFSSPLYPYPLSLDFAVSLTKEEQPHDSLWLTGRSRSDGVQVEAEVSRGLNVSTCSLAHPSSP